MNAIDKIWRCKVKAQRTLVAVTLVMVGIFTVMTACTANPQNRQTEVSQQDSPMAYEKDETMNQSRSLEVVYSSTQCDQINDNQWITSKAQLDKLLQATLGKMISPAPVPSPAVDFDHYGVLLLSMGQQRTGGYAIQLADDQLQMKDSVATVRVKWQKPRPGMMVTQALTAPCLFIKVPRGGYHTLRAVDQRQTVRAELTVN